MERKVDQGAGKLRGTRKGKDERRVEGKESGVKL